jgi:hypothetical protein
MTFGAYERPRTPLPFARRISRNATSMFLTETPIRQNGRALIAALTANADRRLG